MNKKYLILIVTVAFISCFDRKNSSPEALSPIVATENWKQYKSSGFSLLYPGDWYISNEVFYNNPAGKSVGTNAQGSFEPGLIILKPHQRCIDTAGEGDGLSTEIANENIMIGKLEVVKKKYKTEVDGGENSGQIYYISSYCVSQGNKALWLNFTYQQPNLEKKDLYKKIISSIRFE